MDNQSSSLSVGATPTPDSPPPTAGTSLAVANAGERQDLPTDPSIT